MKGGGGLVVDNNQYDKKCVNQLRQIKEGEEYK
jgi:hypothetical protein